MADDFVLPVKLLIKALNAGIEVTNTISASASEASTAKALQISESAPPLLKSLERGSQAIRETYWRSLATCGEPFTTALKTEKSIKDRLNKIKNDLRDKFDEIEEDPESFDPTAFRDLRKQTEKCCTEFLSVLNGLRDQLTRSQTPKDDIPDDRAYLPSRSPPTVRKPVPAPKSPIQPPTPTEPLHFPKVPIRRTPEPVKPTHTPWAIDRPAQFDTGPSMGSSLGSPVRKQSDSREVSPGSQPTERLIPQEIVNFRLNANEEWLRKRRESRVLFQNELQKNRTSRASFASIEENRASEVFDNKPSSLMTSPTLGYAQPAASPVEGRQSRTSLNGYDTVMTRERSHGGHSHTSRDSRTSSMLQEQQLPRAVVQRHDSDVSIFGLRAAPLSPPLSEPRISGQADNWTNLPIASTLRVPGYGVGIEDGLELAPQTTYEDGLIAVNGREEIDCEAPSTPSISFKLVDHPMRHDASYYRLKGFCDGAKAMTRGETGFKVVKRPSGHYSATVSARCVKCAYEVGWNDVEKDRLLDKSGIYGNSGIRWRQKFISKCHIRADSIESSAYACIFCIEEHKTVDDHDATVFFSVIQLFRHLATHPRPLPKVNGITVLYGFQPPTILDFDINFTTMEPLLHTYSMRDIALKVATRPTATALQTFHPKNSTSSSRDPQGGNVLHFAAGARIVGITFPPEFNGTWCIGYADGERGSFPASYIALEKPDKNDYMMDDRSTLIAYAKWDFKPKERSSGTDWLHFKKGEKIVCISYTFHDNWCWSGQTARGRDFGLFPKAFVDNAQEGMGDFAPSSASLKSGGGGLLGKFGLGRNKSKMDAQRPIQGIRSSSMASESSGGGGGGIKVKGQPGLEVVASPVHGSHNWKGIGGKY